VTKKEKLQKWIVEALSSLGDSRVTDVAKHIWTHHEADLRQSQDLLYTWQYDMRWAAQDLQNKGVLDKRKSDRKWSLR
jgi:hypothetical protein